MKRITVGILLLTVVISCNKRRSENPKGGSFQLIMDEKYESALSFFGPDKTYHFPPTPDFNNYNLYRKLFTNHGQP